jgi:hypothetical protein
MGFEYEIARDRIEARAMLGLCAAFGWADARYRCAVAQVA